MDKSSVREVEILFKTPQDFLDNFLEDLPNGGLFCATEEIFSAGEFLDITLSFEGRKEVFHIRGQVRWKRVTGKGRKLPMGVGVEFIEEEKGKVELVTRFAHGEEIGFHERSCPRMRTEIPVEYRTPEKAEQGVLTDLGVGGAYVVQDGDLPERGTPVQMQIPEEGFLRRPIKISGNVAWLGASSNKRGIGIRFLPDRSMRKKVEKFLKRLARARED